MYGPLDVVTLTGEKVRTQRPQSHVDQPPPRADLALSGSSLVPPPVPWTAPGPGRLSPQPRPPSPASASALFRSAPRRSGVPPSPLPPLRSGGPSDPLSLLGGHLHHDAATVGQVDPLWHRGHQQLWPSHLPGAPGACAGRRRLPGAHGGQVSVVRARPLRGGAPVGPAPTPLTQQPTPTPARAVGATTPTPNAA